MYCSLGQNQFFDDAGAPLSAGRVKIYAKGSDTLLPIFEDNGDGFVPAQNPVITANDGRIPTIFWPAALVDVVVEKSNGDGTYIELDSFVAGLDLSSFKAVQGVGSILELRSIMPSENMVVQVNGYYTEGDSPSRKYLWVAEAANFEDGGYVIRSNRDYNGGRWVMLWDDPEFLPVSLYGVMCGYSGYAKTSNIPALEALGHFVLVGNVRVEVPPVILFDWRRAQPTSGPLSTVAYHWSGTFTTTHYVACARGVVFSIDQPPTIHCAGVRGESYATAYWMVDQNYTSLDPAEKISTLMFNGNTQEMHDAFMACASCSKVKVVELSDGPALYDLLDSGDSFAHKIVIDYTDTLSIQYEKSGCVWIQPYYGNVLIGVLQASAVNANIGNFYSEVITAILSVTTSANIGGKLSVTGDVEAIGLIGSLVGYKDGGLTKTCMTIGALPWFPGGLGIGTFGTMKLERTGGATYTDKPIMFRSYSPNGTAMTLDIQSTSANFDPSAYGEGDIVVIANMGNALLEVQYASTRHANISPWQACTFIKPGPGYAYWFCLTPDSVS